MVKITDNYLENKQAFSDSKLTVPTYEAAKVAENTVKEPRMIPGGGGNLFRPVQASISSKVIEPGAMHSGIIVSYT